MRNNTGDDTAGETGDEASEDMGDDNWPGWLTAFATTLRDNIRTVFLPNTCVLHTRLGLDVLRYFGIHAQAEPVAVSAFTADAYAAFQTGEDLTNVGYSVGVYGDGNTDRAPNGRLMWDGHLVLHVAHGPRLVDLTADQLHRPQHGLVVNAPIITPIFDPAAWDRTGAMTLTSPDGTVVLYQRMDNAAWRRAADWTGPFPASTRALVAATIRELRPTPPPTISAT